jgi:hypothetical protein
MPTQWLIADQRLGAGLERAARGLPRGSRVILLRTLTAHQQRRLRHVARLRGLVVVTGQPGAAARVHNSRELTRAVLARTQIVLISPIYPTTSHPDWQPLPRMKAATLARLARRNAFALGGMDSRKFAKIAQLGFRGWAGISAFRT